MKNVSTEFREKVENGSACYAYANVVLRNSTKLTLDPSKDFRIDGNSITTNGGSSFPLGVALSRTIELNLDNYDGRFDAVDFYGAEITLFTGMTLDDGSVEKIKEGIFSVVEPTTPGATITLVAADYMAKTSNSYVPNTTFPATVFNIYRDVCTQCNLVAGSAKFINGGFVVDAISENVTCREMLGYIAMIAGGNAMCDSNGAVIIKSYDFSGLKKSDGTYDYTKAQNFSGFQKSPSISTDMIRITGVKAENDDGDEKQSYIVGSEDYCFLIENPLISGKEAQALQLIGNVIVGLEFYTFSGDHISNPLAEFMDPCFVQDIKGNLFFSILSNITYTYFGSTSISCDTDSPETVKSQKATSGSKVYQNLKKQQQVIKKEFEKQMDALEKQVSNAPGTYISSEVQPDGSSIYYLHDKPTLAESKSVFKITADTITASTDGGKTWNGGFTVDGVMIAKIMTTIGINFDWGVGGTLIIQDRNGKQTVYMDAETGEVRLSVVSLSIQGETVADIAEKKAESSLNDFTSNVYNPMISSLQKQIDGQIETFYYDYEPTLNNIPAKEWDTEEKKTAHEGDLFYWKSKGYAYRFQKDRSAWSWQLVQDTDITLAMQKAAEAKDTADSKRRVFTATPYPPYDVGDLWVGNDTSDLMRCQRSRQSGSYDASDWIKAVKYTDDSELNNFIYTDYAETLVEISNSIDKKAETWFQATDPALQWTDNSTSEPLQDHTGANIIDSTGANILTVWEREKAAHNGDLWHNTTNNVEYIYKDGTWHEMSVPDDVFDKIDGKAQIFVGEPIPPYDVGDTWFTGTTILVCVVKRTSGKYNASDWAKKDTYTDDTALENFLSGDYKETIADLSTQIDGKAETWRQSTDPAANWTTDELKAQHKGDLWNNTENQKTYIYNGSAWQEMTSTPPQAVFDAIDGKAQIFVKQPTTPYDVGDLWFDSSSADIMTCTTARESGNFNAADWEKRNKYTDDSSLNSWIKGDYAKTLEDVQTQIDGKAETWRQSTDPAKSWTTDALKKQHKGDLWYNTTEQKSYIYSGTVWEPMKTEPPSGVYDAIDGKAQIFVSQPKPPYSVGDLWFDSASADIMTCVTSRESGNYTAGDWQKRNKYTDNSAVDALDKALTQLEIFNRLTNNGAAQGVFLKDGKLYLNFSYAQGGTLKLGGANNGNGQAEVYDSSGNKIGSWNKDGFNLQKGAIYGTQIHLESQNDYIQGTVNGNEAVKISTGGVKVDSTANWGFSVTQKKYIFEMNPYVFPGVRLLDQSTGAGIGSTWTSGHFGMCYTNDLSGYSAVTDSLSNYGVYMKAGKEDANGGFYVIGNGLGKGSHVTAEGIYTSGTKNRIVDTENYGQRLQYCYEMSSPFFGDIGEAETDENGLCYVQIDDIFSETVLRNDKYNVFLQKEGCGDLWIEEKTADYFLVKGTPNLSFSWELKAKQADYTLERLEKNETRYEKEPELDYSEIGYQTYIDYVESKIIS
nr:MAG TPA: Putative tail protein [Caudoviricetes sp.]